MPDQDAYKEGEPLIYLLEDDESIRKLVVYVLESQGFQAEGFETPGAFWRAMEKQRPELLLLDIMLPEEDGIAILKKLRQKNETRDLPVIMLTARDGEYDRVTGLDAGADDYIPKPFGMMELVARVRAVLRRSRPTAPAAEFRFRSLYLCPERHEVQVNGETVTLTYKEFQLLCRLTEHQGLVLTREVLLDTVWGLGAERENRTLDVHIRTLRGKLKEAGSLIQTVRGIGYRFVGEEQ